MITDKIILLNKTILDTFNESDEIKILKAFTDAGVKTLEADFGFVWLLPSSSSKEWTLAYKSPNATFIPKNPSEKGRNQKAIKTKEIDFVTKLESRPDAQYVSNFIESFVIIPMSYRDKAYGNIVICFKKTETFPKEKRTLSAFIGNSAAQAITIRKLIETDILLAQEKLKTEFISNATHEFRTPLAIMKGQVELALMEKSPMSKMTEMALKTVDEEVSNLSKILMDLVTITSGQDIKEIANPEPVEIVETLHTTIKRLKTLASKKKVSIKMSQPKGKMYVGGDKNYLERLFLNLIENAINYGKDKILVEVEKKNRQTIVKISDNGVGISKEDLPHIFERFYRVDKSHNAVGKHSGLGLAIVKWIVDIHKGKVEVKSTLGKGTTFQVTLPEAKQN